MQLSKAEDDRVLTLWQKQKEEGVKRKVVGIELTEKAIPRQGYEVFVKATRQSASLRPDTCRFLRANRFAMALVDAAYSQKRHP
ncbi:MAG: hypothetical protein MZU97_00895 [Bacillus subtilis]|nr:hypothetical protein [Bacillus subtilis]